MENLAEMVEFVEYLWVSRNFCVMDLVILKGFQNFQVLVQQA